MATGSGEAPQHDVLRGLALMGEGLDVLAGAGGISLSDGETRDALATVTALSARCRAAYLHLLAAASERDLPSTSTTGGSTPLSDREGAETCTWLAATARMSAGKVRADLREARALDPDIGVLRAMGTELAGGKVTAEHASVAVRALRGLPAKLLRERRADVDDLLTGHAATFDPATTTMLGRHLLATVVPDRADHVDTEAHLRREVHLGIDSTGMGVLRGQLDAATTAQLKAVLDHLSAPHRGPVETGGGEGAQTALTINDLRTPAQRRHDALAEMTRAAAGALHGSVRAGEPPRVVVHTSPDQVADAARAAARRLGDEPGDGDPGGSASRQPAGAASCEQTGPLTPGTLALLLCDAVIDRIVLNESGRVLELTSLGRFFTAAQRHALGARDGGCAFPGCDRPPSWCDAHHVIFSCDGGPTTVENGVLLCGPHHTEIHLGHWKITMRDGFPWFVPPRHLDPTRRPVRNSVHQAIAETRRDAQQLHLDLQPGTTDDPDG